ncbi:hypothetical protein E7W39_13805 [Cronobacter sakazakii]|uniref:Uncharacterized protein n=1 Tax=Cronobacter sakazakii TaxID=28141 RepID=A0AAN5X4Z7_CROSK|nr:hypothetical protein [Cronobacter sakazakii]EGT5186324.1 hypothetical protein [Cronobacter sakazakii]EGT5692415.1 hypothetical protein [Cronobacter sakazakii]EGT5701834.1 hypothetical protein [Cronobacter sakazakii]EGT5718425.1 hypothetical protein [Cronobacter sakazakii]
MPIRLVNNAPGVLSIRKNNPPQRIKITRLVSRFACINISSTILKPDFIVGADKRQVPETRMSFAF